MPPVHLSASTFAAMFDASVAELISVNGTTIFAAPLNATTQTPIEQFRGITGGFRKARNTPSIIMFQVCPRLAMLPDRSRMNAISTLAGARQPGGVSQLSARSGRG